LTASALRLQCVAFGVPFVLEAENEATLERMRSCVPLGTRTDCVPQGGPCYALVEGTGLVVDGALVPECSADAYDALCRELMVHVAEHAEGRVFVHAGVVGWRGGALLLPGVSFAGKTTLVAALLRAGAEYYSDEYAVIDDDGIVHPYARDLQMRCEGGVEQTPVAIAQLHGTAGVTPLRAALVAFVDYAPGAKWEPESISPGLAALEMMRHAIPVQRTPQRVMAALARMMETAVAIRSQRGEADAAANELLRMMDAGGLA
jgi:hypothetical protein